MAKEHSLIFLLGSKIASSFNTDIAKVSKGIVGINTNLSKLDKTQKDIAKMSTLGKSLREDKAKAIQLQQEVQKMAKEIKNTTNPTKELTSSFAAKKRELIALNQRMDKTQESFYKYRDSLRDAGVDTKNLTEESKRLKTELKEQTEAQAKSIEAEAKRNKHIANLGKAKKTGKNLKESGQKQLTTGAVQAGIITMGVKLAIDDESSFADVKKTTGLVGSEAEKFRMQLINATKEIPLMNDEIYNIASAAGQAGIAQSEMIRFTKEASIAAVAFDQSAMDAGATLATWRTGFGLTQDQVMELGDQINYLANNTNATAVQVSDVVNRVGAIGKNAGFSIEQVGALGATLVSMGQGPELASTAIKNMTGALTKSYAVTKSQAGAYAMLGLDAEKVAKSMQTDASGTMFMVLEKINKINPAEKGALISQLFGEEAKAGVSQLAAGLPQLKANLDMVSDSTKYTGSMMAEYESRSATTENSLVLMAKAGQTMATDLTSGLLPSIQGITKEVSEVAFKFRDWSEKHPELSDNLVKVGVGLAALNIGMGISRILFGNVITQGANLIGFFTAKTVAVGVDTVATEASNVAEGTLHITRFKSMILTGKSIIMAGAHKTAMLVSKGATLGMWGAQKLLNLALSNNPAGWVFKGVMLLGAGLVYAYKKSETFRNMVDKIIDKGKKLLDVFKIFDKGKKADYEVNVKTTGKQALDNYQMTDNKLPKGNKATATTSEDAEIAKAMKDAGIPGYATGGVISKPTLSMVGEGGDTEVIVPINSKPRSKALWQKAGEMLGMKTEGQNVSITNTESNVTAQGGGGKTIIIQEIKIIVEGSLDKINDTKAKAKQLAQDVKAELQNIDLDDRRLNLG